jgi:endonuclease YncB( thermonuclease family)
MDSPIPNLLRRRRRSRAAITATLVILLLSILLDRLGAFGHPGDDWANFDRQAVRVSSVMDGDTIRITSPGGVDEEKVRLIGVDAPEVETRDYWADRATQYTTVRLAGRDVTLRLDGTQTRDKYGRLLAYVYVTDADNLNLALVRDGQAYADRRFAHSLRSQFESAEAESRKKGQGLWKDVRDDRQPPWRQRWLAERRSR